MNARVSAIFVTASILVAGASAYDGTLSSAVRAKLDKFALFTLRKADDSFVKKQFDQAFAQYEAFIAESPRSEAAPYAFFRKARCVHHQGDIYKAIEQYEELLDYHPGAVEYAAPALYLVAESHLAGRDLAKAMEIWREMAGDEDYRKHSYTATALNKLAAALVGQDKAAEGIKYYRQCAVDFRTRNSGPALEALGKVVQYHVRISPDEAKLREFYTAVGTFERKPRTLAEGADIARDRLYWQRLWERVLAESKVYTLPEADRKRRFFTYWAGVFENKFPDWPEFQTQAARFREEASADKS